MKPQGANFLSSSCIALQKFIPRLDIERRFRYNSQSGFTRFHLKLRSQTCSSSLCPFSPQAPTVGCVLCVFVVKNPLSVAVLHRSSFIPHRSHRVAARKSTTPCLLGARYSTNVRHHNRPFSALHAPSISVGRFQSHDMHIFDVNKCTYLYRQPPSSALPGPIKQFKCGETWGSAPPYDTLARCSVRK
jgi:hypothetical protein